MTHYENLSELIKDKDNYPNAGGLYIQKSKLSDIENAEYWIVSSKEGKEQGYIFGERGEMIPESLVECNVKSLLDIQVFKGIIDNKIEHNPNLTLEETSVFVEAINYYLENDDFLD
jgi:hypothetical protein